MARGQSNKVIAQALDISHNTVKLHVRHIMDKLNLRSRVEAAVFAFEYRSSPDGIKAAGEVSQKTRGTPGHQDLLSNRRGRNRWFEPR